MACEDLGNEKAVTKDLIDAKALEASVESVSIQPVNTKNLDGSYKVSIRFNESVQNLTMPNALVLCGIQNAKPLHHTMGNKLLYSGILKSVKLKRLYMNSVDGKKSEDRIQGGIGCSMSFTTPGEYDGNCNDVCPETSMLGGDTWFCVCFYDCWWEL